MSGLAHAAMDTGPVLLSTKGGKGGATLADIRKDAAAGDPKACGQLGQMLLRGEGMAQDVPRAMTLLERGARGGDAQSAFRLGMVLDDGVLVPRDRIYALMYFRAAAAGGIPEAYYNVGAAYASGRGGVPGDHVEGLAWLILATQHGIAADGEQQFRDHILGLGHPEWIKGAEEFAPTLQKDLNKRGMLAYLPPAAPPPVMQSTADQIAARATAKAPTPNGQAKVNAVKVPSREIASPTLPAPAEPAVPEGPSVRIVSPMGHFREWPSLAILERDADPARGDLGAQSAWGQVLVEGKLMPEDADRALAVLERAARDGSADAAFQLAELYTKGAKVVKNDEKAFVYSLQAARGGAWQAAFNVGAFYANGRGTPIIYSEALAWLIVARRNHIERGAEQRIRDYLQKSAPQQIPIAEKRADEIERDIAKATAAR